MSKLLSELSRRHVFRVAAAYVVVAWAFELTPEGIRRTESGKGKADKAPMTDLVLVGLLVVVVGSCIVNDMRPTGSGSVADHRPVAPASGRAG